METLDQNSSDVLTKEDWCYFKREFAFGKENDPQYRLTPSSSYFWYRRALQVFNLFEQNKNLFAAQFKANKEKLFLVDIGCGLGYDIF
jgi:hypothetical protein